MFGIRKKQVNMTILGGLVGNGVAWFDFNLYAYFVPTISDLFFPTKSHFISLLLTFGVFASGFFIRPLGGLVLGHLGDLYGRRKVLIFTTILMGVATGLIAFIPTYQQIGIMAPVLLVLLRLLQGFAIGGELNSASSLLIEHAKKDARAFAGSLVMCSTYVGVLSAVGVATIIAMVLSSEQLMSWGWRIAFLFAGLAGVSALIVRLYAKESPKFEAAKKIVSGSTRSIYKKNVHFIFLAVAITSVMAVAGYLFIGYFTTFLIETQGFSAEDAKLINFISMFSLICIIPFFGFLADKIGRKPVVLSGMIFFLLFSYPVMLLIVQKSFTLVLIGELFFVLAFAPITAVIPTILAEFFPTKIRNSASAVGYNISYAMFGGTAPLVAMILVNLTGSAIAPAWYLMGCALFSIIAILFCKDNYKNELL